MKPIYLKRDFEDGYIEVVYENHSYCSWKHFIPDPRKKKHHCPKFRYRDACFGAVNDVMESTKSMAEHVIESARDRYRRHYQVVAPMLMEAARRYDQRYAKFGELGNAQMPLDPDHERMFAALLSLFENGKLGTPLKIRKCPDQP